MAGRRQTPNQSGIVREAHLGEPSTASTRSAATGVMNEIVHLMRNAPLSPSNKPLSQKTPSGETRNSWTRTEDAEHPSLSDDRPKMVPDAEKYETVVQQIERLVTGASDDREPDGYEPPDEPTSESLDAAETPVAKATESADCRAEENTTRVADPEMLQALQATETQDAESLASSLLHPDPIPSSSDPSDPSDPSEDHGFSAAILSIDDFARRPQRALSFPAEGVEVSPYDPLGIEENYAFDAERPGSLDDYEELEIVGDLSDAVQSEEHCESDAQHSPQPSGADRPAPQRATDSQTGPGAATLPLEGCDPTIGSPTENPVSPSNVTTDPLSRPDPLAIANAMAETIPLQMPGAATDIAETHPARGTDPEPGPTATIASPARTLPSIPPQTTQPTVVPPTNRLTPPPVGSVHPPSPGPIVQSPDRAFDEVASVNTPEPLRDFGAADSGLQIEQAPVSALENRALENLTVEPNATQYRQLAQSVLNPDANGAPQSLCFLSAESDVHASDVLVHLGIIYAGTMGKQVLLLDASDSADRLTVAMQKEGLPGIRNMADSGDNWSDIVVPSVIPNLFLLPSGWDRRSPSEWRLGAFARLVPMLCNRFDLILIAATVAEHTADLPFYAACDRRFLLTRLGQTERKRANAVKEGLERSDVAIDGCIVTNLPAS